MAQLGLSFIGRGVGKAIFRTRDLRKTLPIYSAKFRFQSTAAPSSNLPSSSSQEPDEEPQEEEFMVSKIHQNELVPEMPIKGLDIVRRVEKVEKKGSFSVDIFTGRYDADYLTYPEPLDNRVENQQLKSQARMIQQLWPQIWDDELQLQKYNFFNLYQLSATEMMTIFEAIGASSRNCYEMTSPITMEKSNEPVLQQQVLVSRAIISLITKNCLTYWPMHKSENYKLKTLLPKRNITLSDVTSDDEPSDRLPIGFCWTEQAPNLGSLPPQEWQSFGLSGGPAAKAIAITANKTRVLYDESTEHYLVYYRDKYLSESVDKAEDYSGNEPNPASDPFIGCCLVHKSDLKISPVYLDQAGLRYVDIELDKPISEDNLVFPAERKSAHGVNIKALGQIASCSVTLGLLKDSLRRTYKYLIDHKRGLLDCDIIERKLANVTSKIFALESMLYFVAGMFDGLEEGFDAHMEAIILKIVTNEYALDILRELQQVNGSEMYVISRLQDQINIYDSFLDGNIYNRLYLATMGVIWYARSKNMHLNQLRLAPWYPGYFLKTMFKERAEQADLLTLDADIYGNLHPSLNDAASNLEYIVKRVKYATENLCMARGKDVTAAQSSLYRLAQLSIDAFMLTTSCARASKSYCNGSRNGDLDVALATTLSFDLARKVKIYIEEIQITPLTLVDNKAKLINELNIKNGGYYAESPLDPNI